MKIDIRKTGGDPNIVIHRADKVTLTLRPVGRRFALPHDVVHLVVERELGLADGFWGTIAQGGMMPGISVTRGRQRPHAAARAAGLLRANRSALSDAEGIVGLFQRLLDENLGDYRNDLAFRRFVGERRFDAARLERVWQSLVDTRRQWQALPVGAALSLEWPVMPQDRRRRRG